MARAQIDFLLFVLDLGIGGCEDAVGTAHVAGGGGGGHVGLKLIVEVLRGLVEPPATLAEGCGARPLQDGGEGAAGETLALAVVAHGVLGVLDVENRLNAVLLGQREDGRIGGREAILAAFNHLLAPGAGLLIALLHRGTVHALVALSQEARAIEPHLAQHGVGGTDGGAAGILHSIFALFDEQCVGGLQVIEDKTESGIARGACLLPLGVAVNHIGNQGHAAEDAQQAEVVISTHKASLACEPFFQGGGVVGAHRNLFKLVEGKVATGYALPLGTVEAQQQLIVGVGLEILHVVYVAHVAGNALAALQGVVAHHVADEPFGIIGGAILPHQGRIGRIDYFNTRFGRGKISVAGAHTGGFLGEPVVTRGGGQCQGANHRI